VADSTTIKEFLVVLGFKTDETAMQKFQGGIERVTLAVGILGAAVQATAIAVAIGVERFASNLEQLYYAAQRTGSSADQLKAFGLASRNFGSSIEEAMSSAESLAAFMRKNPGGQAWLSGWLKQVGIDAKSLHGEVDWLKALGKLFTSQKNKGQMFMAEQLAGQLGISEHQLIAMTTPGFDKELDEQEKRRKGWEGTAKAAHQFMIQWEDFKMSFQQSMLGFMGPAMGALEKLMKQFGAFMKHHGKQVIKDLTIAFELLLKGFGNLLDWLDAHGNEIQEKIEGAIGQVKKSYEQIKPVLDWLLAKFEELDKATNGWASTLLTVAAALKLIGAGGLVTGLAGLAGGLAKALGGLALGGAEMAVAGATFGTAAAGALLLAAGGIGYVIGQAIYNFLPDSVRNTIGKFVDELINPEDQVEHKKRLAIEKYAPQIVAGPRFSTMPGASPIIHVTTTVNVGGGSSSSAQHIASEAEKAIRAAVSEVIREAGVALQ